MLAYGYKKNNNDDLLELKEASLLCDVKELDKIIAFLQFVKKDYEETANKLELYHSHYRDWDKDWDRKTSDFIIVINE